MSLGKPRRDGNTRTATVENFFEYARERYRIKLARDSGVAPPWTRDEVLQRYRFCNVFREDDRTTQWFRREVRDPLRNNPRVILATVAFRWFNRVETGVRIKNVLLKEGWNERRVRQLLSDVRPLVTGAYMIRTPRGINKLTGICWCMKQFKGLPDVPTLQEAHSQLMVSPYLGAFMAYEIVTDLRHTAVLENATDIYSWANPGPGAARGLKRIYGHMYGHGFNRHAKRDIEEMIYLMQELLNFSTSNQYWPRAWPRWEMREVEHTLCEYDKYCRAQNGTRLKRRYP